MLVNFKNSSLNTNVCFLLNPTAQGDMLICNNINDTGLESEDIMVDYLLLM